jgi:hypothetical protein
LLNNSKYITELFDFHPPTEDSRYNYLMDNMVRDSLFIAFGENKNIASYLNVFNEVAKNINNILMWSAKNYINYEVVKGIADELEKYEVSYTEFDVFDYYLKISKILTDIYNFTRLKKLQDQDIYYDDNNGKYELDLFNAIIDKSKFPRYIIPFVIAESGKIVLYNGVKANGGVVDAHNMVAGRMIFPNSY